MSGLPDDYDSSAREDPAKRAVRYTPKHSRQARRLHRIILTLSAGHEPVAALLGYLALYHVITSAVKGLTAMLG